MHNRIYGKNSSYQGLISLHSLKFQMRICVPASGSLCFAFFFFTFLQCYTKIALAPMKYFHVIRRVCFATISRYLYKRYSSTAWMLIRTSLLSSESSLYQYSIIQQQDNQRLRSRKHRFVSQSLRLQYSSAHLNYLNFNI